MNRFAKVLLLLAMVLIVGFMAVPVTQSQEGENMLIVVYRTDNEEVLGWCEYSPNTVKINPSSIETSCWKIKADWEIVTYGIYQWQEIEKKYEYDEEGEPYEVPWYLSELNLQPLEDPSQALPKSMHIAALTAVDVVLMRATVVRKYEGVNYTILNCRVSQQAATAYQTGALKIFNPAYNITAPENADCFVLVYFISETPYDAEIEIPVIIDKVNK